MLEAALLTQRAEMLNKLGNAAQASEQNRVRLSVGEISEQAQNARDLNTAAAAMLPVDPARGRNLNVVA
jgi:hypothetical protein